MMQMFASLDVILKIEKRFRQFRLHQLTGSFIYLKDRHQEQGLCSLNAFQD